MSQPGILPGASYSQSVALSTELPYAIRAILLLDENHVIIRCPSRASYLEPLTRHSDYWLRWITDHSFSLCMSRKVYLIFLRGPENTLVKTRSTERLY
ncbi:hypothetical protein RRG08_002524 [Elysia crispata]|uniref:Uncharacterized protein n=1 Tax=Elysia crispata TaxID=231223 RepID=A0AAE1DUL0_9GAST|nr:hypothetical protein RRG08_002524 [Elysia crispata]